ncbi:hypothetical protein D3C81_524940 [compost metagenome]
MAWRMQQHQFAARQIDALTVVSHHHTLLGNRFDATIAARDFLGAIDGGGTGDQPGRIDHVRRAARMQHRTRIRQLLHQQASAAGMIQVHVGQQQPVHRLHAQPVVGQGLQHRRHRQAGTAVDERGTTIFDDQVGGIEIGPLETGIDGVDAGIGGHRRAPGRIGNRGPW